MNIFIAFANQDRDVRDKLLRQMNLVKDRLGWNIWSAKEIKAGERWDEEIKQRLIDSEVVILLLSTDFFNSKYIVETELPKVVEKHKQGDCQIIPVIARVCHWKDTPFGEYAELGDIQALPVGERPIMSKGHWGHEDEPYFEVVEGIKDSIKNFERKFANEALDFNKKETIDLISSRNEANSTPIFKNELVAEKIEGNRQGRKESSLGSSMFFKWFSDQTSYIVATSMVFAVCLLLFYALQFYNENLQQNQANLGSTSIISNPEIRNSKSSLGDKKRSGFDMVKVEKGTFTMGSPIKEVGRVENECQHRVSVNAFKIGKYEVTQADWREIMGEIPHSLRFKGCNDCPVEGVSWTEVQNFLKMLNQTLTPGQKKYRLPTEEEWEFAARGGGRSSSTKYSGSSNVETVGWFKLNSDSRTHIVGEKQPNELGIYDMSGNVLEWCQNSWKSYPCDKLKTENSKYYVIRGGDWNEEADKCRVSYRFNYRPDLHSDRLGFRLAQD